MVKNIMVDSLGGGTFLENVTKSGDREIVLGFGAALLERYKSRGFHRTLI